MTNHPANLGSLEKRIMAVLWEDQGATVREVFSIIRKSHRVAYTTVMTVMNRLVEKGLLTRSEEGRAYSYRASQSADETARAMSRTMIKQLIRDFGPSAVVQFVNALDDIDEALVRKMKRAINER